jgi:hypothetical protein
MNDEQQREGREATMSRAYMIEIDLSGFAPERLLAVLGAMDRFLGFGSNQPVCKMRLRRLSWRGEGALGPREDERDYARRLAGEVFVANRAPCRLEVAMVCLEDPLRVAIEPEEFDALVSPADLESARRVEEGEED